MSPPLSLSLYHQSFWNPTGHCVLAQYLLPPYKNMFTFFLFFDWAPFKQKYVFFTFVPTQHLVFEILKIELNEWAKKLSLASYNSHLFIHLVWTESMMHISGKVFCKLHLFTYSLQQVRVNSLSKEMIKWELRVRKGRVEDGDWSGLWGGSKRIRR